MSLVSTVFHSYFDIELIKKKLENQDRNIELVFSYLDELLKRDKIPEPIKRVGFKRKDEG